VIKSRGAKGKARVTFTVDPQVGAQTAAVCGEWNDWSAGADIMHRDAEGAFSVTVDLDAGRPAVGQRLGRRRLRPQRLRGRRLGRRPDHAGRGGPAGREEGPGEEGPGEEDAGEGGGCEGGRGGPVRREENTGGKGGSRADR
jgi:hypothetical protein